MIPKNELRIGNYINIIESDEKPDGSILGYEEAIQIETGADIDRLYKDANPIPLTEQLLVNCGFVTLDSEIDVIVWGLDNPNDEYFNLVSDGLDKPLPIYFAYDVGYKEVRKEITYLHQLQNLYLDLTGEELNIDL